MLDYHVAVFGAGSVGLCLAAHFAKAGARISLLARAGSLGNLSEKPIEVSGLLGDHIIPHGRITLCDAATPSEDVLASDMLVLTAKAYDVADALQPFAGKTQCPPILFMQNGMGAAEIARELLGPEVPVYSTAMMIGMVRSAPMAVSVTAQASPILCGALLGDDEGQLKRMLDVAQSGFIPMEHDKAIRETISFKLLFNSCMNPTGALTGQTYGELLENPSSRDLITGLAEETLAVFAAAYGYRPAENGHHYVDDILSKIVFPKKSGA